MSVGLNLYRTTGRYTQENGNFEVRKIRKIKKKESEFPLSRISFYNTAHNIPSSNESSRL
jgi:hypothetical protein